MTIYTEFDDTNFQFQAAVPIAEAPKDPPKGDIAVGQTPIGTLRFAYKGSFHQMEDTIYNAIPEYLDEKKCLIRGHVHRGISDRSGDDAGGQVRHLDFRAAEVAAAQSFNAHASPSPGGGGSREAPDA